MDPSQNGSSNKNHRRRVLRDKRRGQTQDQVSEKMFTLNVCPTTGGTLQVCVPATDNVTGLKQAVSKITKIPKERITLLFRESVLNEGRSLVECGLLDGGKLTLIPSVETGLVSKKADSSCVSDALKNLTETQRRDFLAGKGPLTLAMRVGDNIMMLQFQLSSSQEGGGTRRHHPSSASSSSAAVSTSATNRNEQLCIKPADAASSILSTSSSSSSSSSSISSSKQMEGGLTTSPDSDGHIEVSSSTDKEQRSKEEGDYLEDLFVSEGTQKAPAQAQQIPPMAVPLQLQGQKRKLDQEHTNETSYKRQCYRNNHGLPTTPLAVEDSKIPDQPQTMNLKSQVDGNAAITNSDRGEGDTSAVSEGHIEGHTEGDNQLNVLDGSKKQIWLHHQEEENTSAEHFAGFQRQVQRQHSAGNRKRRRERPGSPHLGSPRSSRSHGRRHSSSSSSSSSPSSTTSAPDSRLSSSAQTPAGAIIDSMQHLGKGVYSGTFSGNISPSVQDITGKPMTSLTAIVQILKQLLGDTTLPVGARFIAPAPTPYISAPVNHTSHKSAKSTQRTRKPQNTKKEAAAATGESGVAEAAASKSGVEVTSSEAARLESSSLSGTNSSSAKEMAPKLSKSASITPQRGVDAVSTAENSGFIQPRRKKKEKMIKVISAAEPDDEEGRAMKGKVAQVQAMLKEKRAEKHARRQARTAPYGSPSSHSTPSSSVTHSNSDSVSVSNKSPPVSSPAKSATPTKDCNDKKAEVVVASNKSNSSTGSNIDIAC